jgi:hypothetical protein
MYSNQNNFCTNCGTQISRQNQFCPVCGYQLFNNSYNPTVTTTLITPLGTSTIIQPRYQSNNTNFYPINTSYSIHSSSQINYNNYPINSRSISTNGGSSLQYLKRLGSDNVYIPEGRDCNLSEQIKGKVINNVYNRNYVQVFIPFVHNVANNKPEISIDLAYIQNKYPNQQINIYIVYLGAIIQENKQMSEYVRASLYNASIFNIFYNHNSPNANVICLASSY